MVKGHGRAQRGKYRGNVLPSDPRYYPRGLLSNVDPRLTDKKIQGRLLQEKKSCGLPILPLPESVGGGRLNVLYISTMMKIL